MTVTYEVIQDTVLTGTSSIGIGASAAVTIRDAESGALVSLFEDRLGASGESNPFNADSSGQFRVYALPGRLQITVVFNAVTRIWEDYRLGDPAIVKQNAIINGAMRVDQRDSEGTPVDATGGTNQYGSDRWYGSEGVTSGAFTIGKVATGGPPGFPAYLRATNTDDQSSVGAGEHAWIGQNIEGLNLPHYELGTSDAKDFAVGIWVRSTLTGTYCISFVNSANNRSYVAEIVISLANTWEFKTVALTGDLTGTWLITNGIGLRVRIDLGSGTDFNATADAWGAGQKSRTTNQAAWIGSAAATFDFTGVQLILGSVVDEKDFEHVDYATELEQCKRYYESLGDLVVTNESFASGYVRSTTLAQFVLRYSRKRALPSSVTLAAFGLFAVAHQATASSVDSAIASSILGRNSCVIVTTFSGSTLTAGDGVELRRDTSDAAFITIDAEL
ncbi:hypothetical protein LCGC14_2543340 [marine sediment metagenome]|uniref:Uncharacterized protein n=1 Tax=marine sediment metagenome TaxID=412755 RepID=A0A0F9D1L0_9ZZZZ